MALNLTEEVGVWVAGHRQGPFCQAHIFFETYCGEYKKYGIINHEHIIIY